MKFSQATLLGSNRHPLQAGVKINLWAHLGSIKLVACLVLILPPVYAISETKNDAPLEYAKLVDPLIGSKGNGLGCGFTYIGANYPFGMVQFTPSFFTPQKGIVVNQMSGAGCPHMGNFPLLPLVGKLLQSPNDMNNYPAYKSVNEASAGFLSLQMDNNVTCNLSVSKRSGIAQLIFPQTAHEGSVIIGSGVSSTKLSNAFIKITSDSSCEGYAEGGDFCGYKTDYRIYFVAEFNREAKETGTWSGGNLRKNRAQVGGTNSGGYFTFDLNRGNTVEYKIAISYVSVENARENLLKDNCERNFATVKDDTQKEWNRQLGKIEIASGNRDRLKQFYTHWYHTLIHPNIFSDINGEYIGSDFALHQVDQGKDYYTTFSGWDTYRTQCQLLAMFYPKESSEMMQSAVDFADQSGGYGRWVTTNIETGVMQGDPMPIIIANTYAFGGRDFDVDAAYKHMVRGACVPGTYSQNVEVRPGLDNYMKKGVENASLALEYASSDYAIGQYAMQAMGDMEQSQYFINRSANWKNLYDPSTNWLRSRQPSDMKWKDPNHDWREATKENYFWMVPFDLETLIDTMGGNRAATSRLDSLFIRLDAQYDDHHFAAGNEPDFQVPWIYNWTDQPYKTSAIVHRILGEMYSSQTDGLPGNDDCGSMGAWYVFASIGLYPMVPGVSGFSVSLPQFEQIKLHLPQGVVRINGGSATKHYVGSLKIDGAPYRKLWIDWSAIQAGAELEYRAEERPDKKWGLKR